VADRMKRDGGKSIDQLSWTDAVIIGLMQCLALIPGISRSGSTMVGGYRVGLNHEDAARFSFLTATPIILGATVFELPKLLKSHAAHGGHMLQNSVIAGVVAGVAAYVSVWILMRWFKQHEVKGFTPFALYCVFAGVLALAWKLMAR
jgi:undecaprenyl-diphosphatase